jgi:hypothetical protein
MFILFERESWCLELQDEPTMKMSENGVMRTIFGLKRLEVIRHHGKQYDEELRNIYYAPNIIKFIKSRNYLQDIRTGQFKLILNEQGVDWIHVA